MTQLRLCLRRKSGSVPWVDEKQAALTRATRDRARVQDCIDRSEASIEAAYVAGNSLSEIANALEMSGEGIRRILVRRKATLRPKHVRNAPAD